MTPRQTFIPCLVLVFTATLNACGGGGGGGGGDPPTLPGTIQLSGTSFDVSEGQVANIAVTRSGGNSGVASVDYAITDGTAVSGSDYEPSGGTLTGTITFSDQQSGNQTISIIALDDTIAEGLESLTLTLSNVSRATLGPNSSATINIIDNDTAALSAFGPITELSSATVNGIRYETVATNVNINGQPANVSDLKLGQLVAIEGDVNFSHATGTADQIDYIATVIGPVENIDAAIDRLLVMGQTVLTNSNTVFDPSIDPDTFAGLSVGASTQISGYLNDAGDIIATRIDLDTTSTDVRLIGTVSGLNLDNMLFSINRLSVDYGSATLIDLPGGMPTDGMLVFVNGSLTNGVLVVDEIGSINNLASTPGARVHLAGVVTRFASVTDFDLNGFPITTNAGTVFVNGVVGDLGANAEITIDGEVGPGGDAVAVTELTFGRPVFDRTTITFDFENFTKISVFGLSRVTVSQGPDFSVEATGNADIINDIQVTLNGDTVTFGNEKTQLMDAVVTMPVLDQIDVAAGALADVTIRNFDQTQMTVNVEGVSRLRGEGLQIGDLKASVSGVSLLDFGGIRPIGNANINVSGVIQAVLNMQGVSTMAGSVQTGQGTGHSILFYYGTSVTVNVTTDALSEVTRLGDTRP
ncbi:MAG: DUF5666 domain-containing protein [Gammaproteobacteria bacterium]|nr:DUF5666 domain-containing protein [Gammaproteobacteria bacterium]